MKSLIIASTRPELIKLSPAMKAFDRKKVKYVFVATGQHYDRLLFMDFLEDLELGEPEYNIEVGSGSQGYQTSSALAELEKIMLKEKPDVVIVEGDTNSVLSGALAAVKLRIPVAHVEAGLRSFDRTMPEEINRILADHCSEILFAPTETSALNLINEGILPDKIFIVGNTVVDATLQNRGAAKPKGMPEEYVLLTLHRAENVDDPERLSNIAGAIGEIDGNVIFPVHPRTKKMLEKFGVIKKLKKRNVSIIEPLHYRGFLALLDNAKLVLTDSGGVQEEAIILNTPCITLRNTTERPETVEAGGNIVAGVKKEKILEKVKLVLSDEKLYRRMKSARNPFGKGNTGNAIVKILIEKYERGELCINAPSLSEKPKRRTVTVGKGLEGKKIKELGFTVLKVFEDGRQKYPHSNLVLKRGQIVELLE